MRTKIPLWINGLQVVILLILAFQTYACYLNPGLIYPGLVVTPAAANLIYTLAGRNAVMLVISAVALVRQEPRFYSFAFLMHAVREAQDMFIVPLTSGPAGVPPAVLFLVFLVVFLIPEGLAFWTLNRMAAAKV